MAIVTFRYNGLSQELTIESGADQEQLRLLVQNLFNIRVAGLQIGK